MIGAEGEAFKVAMGDLDTARVHTAARATAAEGRPRARGAAVPTRGRLRSSHDGGGPPGGSNPEPAD